MTESLPQSVQLALRALKKTAGVLLALVALDRPIGALELSDLLEMDYKTVQKYLRMLADSGLAMKVGRLGRFVLTPEAHSIFYLLDWKFSNPSTTTIINQLTDLMIKSLAAVEDNPGKKSNVRHSRSGKPRRKPNARSNPEGEDADEAFVVEDLDPGIVQALIEAGITINDRTRRLAQMPHMTPEYVRGHTQDLHRKKKGRQTGLLVTILESGQPVPQPEPDPNDRRRYITGELRDMIEPGWDGEAEGEEGLGEW